MLTNLILKRKFSMILREHKGFFTKLCMLNTFIQKPLVNSEKRSIFVVQNDFNGSLGFAAWLTKKVYGGLL